MGDDGLLKILCVNVGFWSRFRGQLFWWAHWIPLQRLLAASPLHGNGVVEMHLVIAGHPARGQVLLCTYIDLILFGQRNEDSRGMICLEAYRPYCYR